MYILLGCKNKFCGSDLVKRYLGYFTST